MTLFYIACIVFSLAAIIFCWWLFRDYRRQRIRTKELEERLQKFKGLHIEEEKIEEL